MCDATQNDDGAARHDGRGREAVASRVGPPFARRMPPPEHGVLGRSVRATTLMAAAGGVRARIRQGPARAQRQRARATVICRPALGASPDDASWTPTEFLALQRAACAERICSRTEPWSSECEPQRCNGGVIGAEAWRLYDELATAGRPESVAVTRDQWLRILDLGREYGVSTNLEP